MASLLDTIKRNLGQQPSVTPELGQTQQIQNVLRAKSGRQVGGAGPRQSQIGEQVAAQQAQTGASQLAQRGALLGAQQSEQFADITQRADLQRKEFRERQERLKSQHDRQVFNLLDEFGRGNRRLDNRKDISDLEQAGFMARLGNEQYISRIQQEGQKNRLDNELNYKEQVAREAFAEDQALLEDSLEFKRMINMNEREFASEMSQMDINQALDIARSQARAENAQTISEGVGRIVRGTIEYGEEEGWF